MFRRISTWLIDLMDISVCVCHLIKWIHLNMKETKAGCIWCSWLSTMYAVHKGYKLGSVIYICCILLYSNIVGYWYFNFGIILKNVTHVWNYFTLFCNLRPLVIVANWCFYRSTIDVSIFSNQIYKGRLQNLSLFLWNYCQGILIYIWI